MNLLTDHAREVARDGVATALSVTLTRRPDRADAVLTPGSQCRGCRRQPAVLTVAAGLVAVDPAHQPTVGTLGRVEAALCSSCIAFLAPALPAVLADDVDAPGAQRDLTPEVAPLLRWLGADGRLIAAADVRCADGPPTEGEVR